MPTPTVENYVKAIYELQRTSPEASAELVQLGRLATTLGVVPGTVTTMIRTLSDAHLVAYEPRVGVRLTPEGEQLALHVLRRHRVVESFLVKVLGLDWSEVHDEAEELEHVISEKVLERMDALLGRPRVDPHGDPIPDARGRIAEDEGRPLTSYSAGQAVTVTRVESRDAEFLRFLNASKLTPGTTLHVLRVDAQAGTLTLKVEGARQATSLSLTAAGRVMAAAV
ncbi:MAG: metal-dependent transcriptional regulator [Tepidisphaeraceae bacterium]